MATNITVAVRVRPLSSQEKARSHPCIVVQDGRQVNVIDPDDKVLSDTERLLIICIGKSPLTL